MTAGRRPTGRAGQPTGGRGRRSRTPPARTPEPCRPPRPPPMACGAWRATRGPWRVAPTARCPPPEGSRDEVVGAHRGYGATGRRDRPSRCRGRVAGGPGRCPCGRGLPFGNGIHFHVAWPRPRPGEFVTAVPKRRTSRGNTRHRRAQWKATAPRLVPVAVGGVVHLVPQRLAGASAYGPGRTAAARGPLPGRRVRRAPAKAGAFRAVERWRPRVLRGDGSPSGPPAAVPGPGERCPGGGGPRAVPRTPRRGPAGAPARRRGAVSDRTRPRGVGSVSSPASAGTSRTSPDRRCSAAR